MTVIDEEICAQIRLQLNEETAVDAHIDGVIPPFVREDLDVERGLPLLRLLVRQLGDADVLVDRGRRVVGTELLEADRAVREVAAQKEIRIANVGDDEEVDFNDDLDESMQETMNRTADKTGPERVSKLSIAP